MSYSPTEPVNRTSSWALFAVCVGAPFLILLDPLVMYIEFPVIRNAFPDATPSLLSWILNVYTILFATLLVPAGRMSDLKGHKHALVFGMIVFISGALLAGSAPSAAWLIAARAVQAVGAATVIPASMGLILATFPVEKRARAIGLWGSAGGIGAVSGPIVGALITQAFGWRWVFFAFEMPLSFALLYFALRKVATPRRTSGAIPPRALSVLLLASAISAMALGLVKSRVWGLNGAWTWSWILAGVGLLALFVVESRREHASAAIDLRLFEQPDFRNANLATFLFGISFIMMFLGNLVFLQQVWRYSLIETALGFAPGSLAIIPAAAMSGRLTNKYGARMLILVGASIFAAGGAWFWLFLSASPDYFGTWLPGVLLQGAGAGISFSALSRAAVTSLAPRDFGVGSAINQAVRALGNVIGVAITLALVGQRSARLVDFDYVFFGIFAGSALTALFLVTRLPVCKQAAHVQRSP